MSSLPKFSQEKKSSGSFKDQKDLSQRRFPENRSTAELKVEGEVIDLRQAYADVGVVIPVRAPVTTTPIAS